MTNVRRNRFCQLVGVSHPILQGPFGGGLSTVTLAALVSNLGGLGSFGAQSLAPQQILDTAQSLRAATAQPFALNLWVSSHDPGADQLSREQFEHHYAVFEPFFRELGLEQPEPPPAYGQRFEDQIAAVLEAQPAVFSFVFGVPPAGILQRCRAQGIVTVGAATTLAEARVLEAAGVDAIVASGFEAGGHRPSFLAPAEESLYGTFALAQLIAAQVSIPVIAAGGIATAQGVAAALTLGADAVQVGSAFLACAESGASELHRALIRSGASERTILTRSFSGRLARGLRGALSDRFDRTPTQIAPFPVQNWFTAQLKQAALDQGRSDLLTLWCGQIGPLLTRSSATAVFTELQAGSSSFANQPSCSTNLR